VLVRGQLARADAIQTAHGSGAALWRPDGHLGRRAARIAVHAGHLKLGDPMVRGAAGGGALAAAASRSLPAASSSVVSQAIQTVEAQDQNDVNALAYAARAERLENCFDAVAQEVAFLSRRRRPDPRLSHRRLRGRSSLATAASHVLSDPRVFAHIQGIWGQFMAMAMSRILVATGAIGLLAAAGCSSNSSPSAAQPAKTSNLPPIKAVQLAARQSQTETSMTANISISTQGSTAMNSSGTVQEQRKPTLFVNVDMPSVTVNGQKLSGGMTEILTPSTLYMRMSELSQMTGKPWLKLPFSELSGLTGGVNVGQLIQQASNSEPTSQAEILAGASNVRTVGTSVIDGVPVTEYTGTISMATALQRIPAADRAQVSQLISKAGITSANFTVWLDSQNQIRKLIMSEKGSSITETTMMQVTSINQPISTQLPPASQTTTVPASALKS
jgi:hypothetical protein